MPGIACGGDLLLNILETSCRPVLMNTDPLLSCLVPGGVGLPSFSCEIRTGTLTLLSGSPDRVHQALRLAGLREGWEEPWVRLPVSVPPGARARLEHRNQRFGFLFGAPCLLPAFTVLENVAMPFLKMSHGSAAEAGARARHLLRFAGLGEEYAALSASAPSLPDQHRVALARALINEPVVLFLEEIPDDLDEEALRMFARLLRRTVTELGCAVLAPDHSVLRPFADQICPVDASADPAEATKGES